MKSQLSELSPSMQPAVKDQLQVAAENYLYWWDVEFSKDHDPSQVHGETNVFRYRPRPWHILRIQDTVDPSTILDFAKIAIATRIAGSKLMVSVSSTAYSQPSDLFKCLSTDNVYESDSELAARLSTMKGGSLRINGTYDPNVFAPAVIGNIPIFDSNVLSNGRLELLNICESNR